jgi:hypothetical protein
MIRTRTWHEGVALLEAALVAVLMLTLLLGGLAVRQVITRNDEVRQVASRALGGMRITPLEISFTPSGEPSVMVRTELVRDAVREVAEAAELLLTEIIRGNQTQDEPYFVEAKFVVVHVDPSTGEPTGVIETPALASWTRGSLVPDQETEERTNLDSRFEQLVQQAGGVGDGGLFAIPTGMRGEGVDLRFLPRTVLVGMRVVTGAGDELTARLWSEMSGETMIGASKAVVLRSLVE